MADGLAELTDKEKAALRLLLAGHDAKSSAAELGISPHTLTDRLRHARRKLDVTSSREAARILGEAEGTIPQSPVHTPLGGAATASGPNDDGIAEQADGTDRRPAWRSKGAIIMFTTAAIATIALVATVGQSDGDEGPASVKSGSEAAANFRPSPPIQRAASESAAREWLRLVDAGNAEASRAAAGERLRKAYSADFWELGVLLRLNNSGMLVERRLVGVERRDGEGRTLEVLTFESDFAKKTKVLETLYMQRIDGAWKVVDFTGSDEESC